MLKRQRLGLYPCPKDSRARTIFWYYSWPIRAVLFCTLPNPKTMRKLYVLTFLICIVWIGVITYLIFFMLIVICKYKRIVRPKMTTNRIIQHCSLRFISFEYEEITRFHSYSTTLPPFSNVIFELYCILYL